MFGWGQAGQRLWGTAAERLAPAPSAAQRRRATDVLLCLRPSCWLPALQALAARLRPAALPTYEILYKTAEESAARREEQRRMAEAAKLKVGGWRGGWVGGWQRVGGWQCQGRQHGRQARQAQRKTAGNLQGSAAWLGSQRDACISSIPFHAACHA